MRCPGMRGVTDRLTRYASDKILRVRVLNYTSDTLTLWCSILQQITQIETYV